MIVDMTYVSSQLRALLARRLSRPFDPLKSQK
jgi:hypothetical protein